MLRRLAPRSPSALLVLRVLAGTVFVIFGLGKFVNHASELSSFRSYGLPAPELFVLVIGVIELIGGLLLLAGLYVRPVALVLAADMVGAIVVSGIAKGELISLTLAPAELIAMLVLAWSGPGAHVVGRRRNRQVDGGLSRPLRPPPRGGGRRGPRG